MGIITGLELIVVLNVVYRGLTVTCLTQNYFFLVMAVLY